MALEHKRIVCDIDDTISFTLNRDWENAVPNQPVIDKINQLYDMGWEIYLVTARGSISCKSREEAKEKYGAQIKKWLLKHGVKYHVLSFEKYLAAYYVDDKALTPEQFVDLEVKTLKDGWSGAHVELREGRVYKTHHDSIDAAAWYQKAKSFFDVPKIHTLIGNTICMEYIHETGDPVKMKTVLGIINDMKNLPSCIKKSNGFSYYISRIHKHLEYPETYERFKNWGNMADFMGECWSNLFDALRCQISFCHGDFTLENILVSGERHYLIDPIYEPNKDTWSSWLLDVSKMLYSLRRHDMFTEYYYLYENVNSELPTLLVSNKILTWLEMSHIIRVYKYSPETERPKLREMYDSLSDEMNYVLETKIF